MSIAAGTPTVEDKIRAAAEAIFGKVPPADQPVVAGELRDLHQAVDILGGLFGPTLVTIEQDSQQEVVTFLKGILAAVPSFTSVSSAIKFVEAALVGLEGPIKAQLGGVSQSALITLVSAALTAVGHLNLPIA